VEHIKGQEAAEEERRQARMRELAEQAKEQRETEAAEERKRKEERDAKVEALPGGEGRGRGAASQEQR
jgi:hypothetical protein